MNRNEHLIPQLILDIGDRIAKSNNQNEVQVLKDRLESIREYCETILKRK
jgi:hypothetical protein